MNYPCFCHPCFTSCYPPCCTLCYVPYILCCNPCCPTKKDHPVTPKKISKFTNVTTSAPPDNTKAKATTKKEGPKDSKQKEEKKTQSPKKTSGGGKRKKGGGGDKGEKKVNAETKEVDKGGKKVSVTKNARSSSPVAKPASPAGRPEKVDKPDTAGNAVVTAKQDKRQSGDGVTSVASKKSEPKVGKVREEKHEKQIAEQDMGPQRGAGDSVSARRTICKCFSKPQTICKCFPKPQGAPMFPSLQNRTRQPGILGTCTPRSPCTPIFPCRCTPKPPCTPIFPRACTPKLPCTPIALGQGRQPGTPQIYPGREYRLRPCTGDGLPTCGTSYKCACKPRGVMSSSENNRWQPGTSQMHTCARCKLGQTREICGTCGSIKIKPNNPVQPKKLHDCCFKCSVAIR